MNPNIYNPILSEIFFILIGLVFTSTAARVLKDKNNIKRYTGGAFWLIIAVLFIFGPYIPYVLSGILIVISAIITSVKGVEKSKGIAITSEETRINADKIGNLIFIPSVTLALTAVLAATTKIVSSNNAIGISAIFGFIAVFIITKAPLKYAVTESARMIDTMGPTCLLPQTLGALGALFTACGVGDVVANSVSKIIPEGNRFIAVAVYCIGMALFTAIMGNGFAAFSVMTVGIGIPFLINHGANPVIVGALGMTAGFCGTLVTPMAANFNIMPAALLETNNKYAIIKAQAPFAFIMLIFHIILMYFWAF